LQFSGDEPERATLLRQYLPLDADRTYHLRWQIESRFIDIPSGMTWHLQPVETLAEPDLQSGDLAQSSPGEWQFRVPSGAGLYRLALEYARPLGHPRATGTVILKSVHADPE
jgi:hypothetical protein